MAILGSWVSSEMMEEVPSLMTMVLEWLECDEGPAALEAAAAAECVPVMVAKDCDWRGVESISQ